MQNSVNLDVQTGADEVMPASGWTLVEETWTYASADAPTFTFTVNADVTNKYSAGMKIKLTQTTVKYFIITAVSAYTGGNTTITVYGGTDYALVDAAITSPYYSTVAAPFGFPKDPAKWTVTYSDATQKNQGSPAVATWYNLGGSLVIPIGIWKVKAAGQWYADRASGGSVNFQTTLSTANNSESSKAYTIKLHAAALTCNEAYLMMENYISLAAKTTYYYNVAANEAGLTNFYLSGDITPTIIKAVCAYL